MATKVSASYIDSLVHSGSYVRKEIQQGRETIQLTINKETGKMYVVYNKRGESGFGSVSGMDIEPKVLATSSEEGGSLVNLEFDDAILRSLSEAAGASYDTNHEMRNYLIDTINKARGEILNNQKDDNGNPTLTTSNVPYTITKTKDGYISEYNSKGFVGEVLEKRGSGGTNTITEGENPNEPTAPTAPGGNVDLSSIDNDFTKNREIGAINRGKLIYRYPSNMPEDIKYDYIKIVVYEYEPLFYGKTLNDMSNNTNIDLTDSISGNRHRGDARAIIILPMVPTISESNSVGWGEDRMNEVQKRFGALAGATIENKDGKNLFDVAREFIGGAVNIGIDFANDKKTKDFLSSFFAGQAVQAPGLIQRMGGIAINNNLELLFNGPNLRIFNFNFQMRPRSEDEAIEIRDIIRIFKKAMAPEVSESNLFLKTPDVFEIKYIHNETATKEKGQDQQGQDQPYLNKIKTCAMQSFNVNYVPDGSYMTYDGGSMTGYNIDMSFKELLPIYANDMDKNEKSTTGY